MKNNFIKIFISLLLILGVVFGSASGANAVTVGEINDLADGVLLYREMASGAADLNDLINGKLANQAGTGQAEWYVISLSQYLNADFSGYISSLSAAASAATKATDMQRIALAFSAVGANDDYIRRTINSCADKLGIMSRIYGLILMDSRAYPDSNFTRDGIINEILSMRLADGGWALYGSVSDIDVTAMAIQALAPYYKWDDVRAAVDGALLMLSSRQLADGDYASWGTRNLESTAQVLCALCALGIDPENDARFIKGGHSLLDGMLCYHLSNGGFSHNLGGSANDIASAQALCGLVSLKKLRTSGTSLYRFSSGAAERVPAAVTPSAASPEPQDNSTVSGAGVTAPSAVSSGTASSEQSNAPIDTPEVLAADAPGENSETAADGTAAEAENSGASSYKPVAFIVLFVLAAGAAVLLIVTQRLSRKNILLLVCVTLIAALAIAFVNIRSVDDYYGSRESGGPSGPGVTFEIRCDNVVGVIDADHIPKDGCILAPAEYELKDGETVFDILLRATAANRVQMEYDGSKTLNTVYIKGINYLYERDAGELSGWIYRVNGEIPGVGCSEYKLSDGDKVDFVYTLDLGRDVA